MADDFLSPTFRIEIEPKQNFHYRYVSELKNTHGVINGQPEGYQSSVLDDVYPTISLQLPADGDLDKYGNKRDFHVLVSLHSYDAKTGEPYKLSPHLLMPKRKVAVDYDFIFVKMDECPNDKLKRQYQLKDYVVVRLTKEDYRLSLENKMRNFNKRQLPLDFNVLKGNLDITDSKAVRNNGILNVCLGFTVFERNFYDNKYSLYKETIYSKNIFHGDDLRIHRLCNVKASKDSEITVLIKMPSGNKYRVHLFRLNQERNGIVWEKTIPISSRDVFSSAAITFKMPEVPIDDDDDDDDGGGCGEIELKLEIIAGESNYKSRSVPIWYLREEKEHLPRKIARRHEAQVHTDADTTSLAAINPCDMHYPMINAGMSDVCLEHTDEDITPLPAIYPCDMHNPIIDAGTSDMCLEQLVLDNADDRQANDSGWEEFLNDLPDLSYEDTIDPITINTTLPEGLHISRDKAVGAETEICAVPSSTTTVDTKLPEALHISRDKVVVPVTETSSTVVLTKATIDVPNLIYDHISDILKEGGKSLSTQGVCKKHGNTVFHDAIMNRVLFVKFYRIAQSTEHKDLILKARNGYRHNLLHYACYRNKPYCIRPLVMLGCSLCESDRQGRTPLHLAIKDRHMECILKFQGILKSYPTFDQSIKNQLVKMFTVYDDRGHTVLHAAVLENLPELLRDMLEFCKQTHLDVKDYEVLGSGDSIVHLIAKRGLVDMMAFIGEYIPDYLEIENYPGETVCDLKDLSDEMHKVLNITDD